MPEEEILKNKDTLKAELEAYNQKQTKLFEEEKQKILQLIKQREAAKTKPTREDMDER